MPIILFLYFLILFSAWLKGLKIRETAVKIFPTILIHRFIYIKVDSVDDCSVTELLVEFYNKDLIILILNYLTKFFTRRDPDLIAVRALLTIM